MTARTGRIWQRWWGVQALAVAVLAIPAGGAWADHTAYTTPENKLGYSACVWAPGRVVTVGVDPMYPFPDQSYSDRLDEVIGRWNTVLATASVPGGMTRLEGAIPDVVVQYRQTGTTMDHGVLAETFLQREGDTELSPDSGRCPDRQPRSLVMRAAQILINPRDDWYTAPDSSVGMWQMCDQEGFRATNPSLCADQVDFASTMIHELGHTLVFLHPQTLDDIDSVPLAAPNSASSAAKCVEATGSFPEQATMCSGQGLWRGEQRDLETWDVETAHKHYS
ncbi:MAG: hypothetical protein ACRDYV_00080 [Acidimicrobiia bacterium]